MSMDLSKITVAQAFRHLDPSQGLADESISTGFSSMRYRGKQWTLQHAGNSYPLKREDDGTPLSYIDCIIVGISPGLSKSYFGPGDWSEESASAPICTSLRGDVPDNSSTEKQAKSCGICPHNEWITKPNGGRGKECQDHKRLAILLMPAMTRKILKAPLLEPVHLKVPPASLRTYKAYRDGLANQGIPYASVVTRVAFSSERIFQMTFEAVQGLTDAEAGTVLPLMEHQQTKAIIGAIPGATVIDETPAIPPPSRRVETGLLAAFKESEIKQEASNGEDRSNVQPITQAPKKRGRPPKPAVDRTAEDVELPADTQEAAPAPQPTPAPIAAAVPEPEATEAPWEESDTDLDDTVAKLIGDKMGKMLK